MQIKWLRSALANLNQEASYIAQDNPQAVILTVTKIRKSVEPLTSFPAMGRPGRVSGTRELIIDGTPYLIPYRVRGEFVEILRVFHASRQWPKKF